MICRAEFHKLKRQEDLGETLPKQTRVWGAMSGNRIESQASPATVHLPVAVPDPRGAEMPRIIDRPTLIQAAGSPPKEILEFIGRVNSGTADISIAKMKSPPGWSEPGQTPEFAEYSVVLSGALHVRLKDRELIVKAGQAVIVEAGTWVKYSTPEGAEYLAVCVPAFSPETVHREPETG